MMPDKPELEAEQRGLLSLLVEAARKVPRDKRGKFMFVETFGGQEVSHPGLPDWNLKAYKGDLEILARESLLFLSGDSRGTLQFDVTPRGFKFIDQASPNSDRPAMRVDTPSKASILGKSSINILEDILEKTRSTGTGVDAVYYRAQRDDQLELLDKLEGARYLRRELQKYWVSLYGLNQLDDEKTNGLKSNFEKVFLILRSHYKSHPLDKIMVAELARLASLSFKETGECLGYMIQAHQWVGSCTTSLDNPAESYVSPAETILKYKTFQDIIAEIVRQQREQEANPQMAEFFLSEHSQGNPLDLATSDESATTFSWALLHPKIAAISKTRFESGHYADAVEASLKAVNNAVKQRVRAKCNKELDGAALMATAFSPKKPIIVLDDLNTQSGRDIQLGYMQIFSGAMTGIRNPKAHDNITITGERAIHYLYLASLLMHKLDEAED